MGARSGSQHQQPLRRRRGAAVTGAADAEKIIGWIQKVLKYIEGYSPEITSLNVNLKTCETELELVVDVPAGLRRKLGKIKIPAYGNFAIDYVQDASFRKLPQLWTYDGGVWVAKASQLPPGKFLIRMRGSLPPDAKKDLVRIQPALNRDRTETEEMYWLDTMIQSPETMEAIYNNVNVDEVAVGVRISLQRSFAATVPKEVSKKIEAAQRWVEVGQSRDRQEVFHQWWSYRRAQGATEISVDEIMAVIYQQTKAEVFKRHVRVDSPYRIGEIQRRELKAGPLPEDMDVEALTRLTLKSPVAQGSLVFGFKEFEQELIGLFGGEEKRHRRGKSPKRAE